MTYQEFFLEILKWAGGGGVALLGLWLTKLKDGRQDKFGIINELQEENKRKDDRLDKQDEKIQFLTDQMDEMRKEMFTIQTDKHRSEMKNIQLKNENEKLTTENAEMAEKMYRMKEEKDKVIEDLRQELKAVKIDLNKRLDRLIKENEELRRQIMQLKANNG